MPPNSEFFIKMPSTPFQATSKSSLGSAVSDDTVVADDVVANDDDDDDDDDEDDDGPACDELPPGAPGGVVRNLSMATCST